jgi:hypothetical protein
MRPSEKSFQQNSAIHQKLNPANLPEILYRKYPFKQLKSDRLGHSSLRLYLYIGQTIGGLPWLEALLA